MDEQRPTPDVVVEESQVAPLRLLVVDHDGDMSCLVCECLERAGHHVVACNAAEAALDALGHAHVDLVIVREHSVGPLMSGVELLQLLSIRSMPAIMLADYYEERLYRKTIATGTLDFVIVDRALMFLGELPGRVSEALARFRLRAKMTKLSEEVSRAAEVARAAAILEGWTFEEIMAREG